MEKTNRVLAAAVAVLALALVVLAAVTAQELAEADRQLRALEGAGDDGQALDEPLPETHPAAAPQVGIAGVQAVSGTLGLTLTVRSSAGGDLLYEPPVLADEAGATYPVTAESLEEARLAFLDLVTRNQATARLVFSGQPPAGSRLELRFNPGQPADGFIAPPLQVAVPQTGGGQ